MTRKMTPEEKKTLLMIARQAIEKALKGEPMPPVAAGGLPPGLLEPGACFVTLTKAGQLRGCVGSIRATQPLIYDVRDRSVAAAFEDPRFPPLTLQELEELEIEISTLTDPAPLFYDDAQDLVRKLQVGVDGVILKEGFRRATFLPQVWEKLSEPELFLSRLCQKMGLEAEAWRYRKMEVEIYQVEKFTESGL
jgi:AmmeMemoRadiSam system protein A